MFMIADLVLRPMPLPMCRPTCFTSQDFVPAQEEVVAAQDPSKQTIANKINTNAAENPTQAELKILEAKLQAAMKPFA
jgi:hypothetical protein